MKSFLVQYLYWFMVVQITTMLFKQVKANYTLREKKFIIGFIGFCVLPIAVGFIVNYLMCTLLPYRYVRRGITDEICLIALIVSIPISIFFTRKLIKRIKDEDKNQTATSNGILEDSLLNLTKKIAMLMFGMLILSYALEYGWKEFGFGGFNS